MQSEKDFTEIYHTHAPKIFRLCLGYASGDEDLAKEWVQRTFIKVWNHRRSFKGESAVGTWIYRIAINVCLSDLRKKRKHKPIDERAMLASTEEHEKDDKDQIAKMYRCIDQLTEQNRILILMELENIPQQSIAETVGLAHGSVRTRLSRIRKALLKCINHEK